MTIQRIDLKTGQVPTEADWESFFNRVIDYLNDGVPITGITKDASGKLAVSITGDATTVGGLTPDQIIAGDIPDLKKTMIDMLSGGPLVISGGVSTKDGVTGNQLNITAVKLVLKVTSTGYITRVELPNSTKTTSLGNTTYYLDVVPGATDYTWGTAHPAGDYATLATVNTDASGNISAVTDTRALTVRLFQGFDVKMQIPKLEMAAGYGISSVNANELTLFHPANGAVKVRQTTDTGPVLGTVYHSGNDGRGSGLDADRIRGYVPQVFAVRGWYDNAFRNTNPAFPVPCQPGAKAVGGPDGRWVYFQGSNTGAAVTTGFYRRDFAQFYNVGWSTLTASPTPWKNGADILCLYDPSVTTHKHKVYAMYGGGAAEFRAYNPDTNAWEAKANLPAGSNVGGFICEGPDQDSIFYVPGGKAANTAGIYKYTISTNTWSASLANVPYATNDGTCADAAGEYIFVRWGGTANVSQFNPANNAWSSAALGANSNAGAKMVHLGGGTFAHYIGGQTTEPLRHSNLFHGVDYGSPTTIAYVYPGCFIFLANGRVYFSSGNGQANLYMWGV